MSSSSCSSFISSSTRFTRDQRLSSLNSSYSSSSLWWWNSTCLSKFNRRRRRRHVPIVAMSLIIFLLLLPPQRRHQTRFHHDHHHHHNDDNNGYDSSDSSSAKSFLTHDTTTTTTNGFVAAWTTTVQYPNSVVVRRRGNRSNLIQLQIRKPNHHRRYHRQFGLFAALMSEGEETTTTATTTSLPSLTDLRQLTIASSLSYLTSTQATEKVKGGGGDNSPFSILAGRKREMEMSPYYKDSDLIPLVQVVDIPSGSGATIFVTKTPIMNEQNDNYDNNDKHCDNDSNCSHHHIIVACRGTSSIQNFITNLKFTLVPVQRSILLVPPPQSTNSQNEEEAQQMNNSSGKEKKTDGYYDDDGQQQQSMTQLIHEGFQDASIGLWKQLEPQLISIIHERQQQQQQQTSKIHVTFTGHSLGAATALLCGVQFASSSSLASSLASTTTTTTHERISDDDHNSNSDCPISGISYSIVGIGGPRLVNHALSRYLQQKVLCDAMCVTNLVHSRDPILRQNQKLWDSLGFDIVGTERLCSMDTLKVYETSRLEEDVVATNFLDHCQYLGVFVGPRII